MIAALIVAVLAAGLAAMYHPTGAGRHVRAVGTDTVHFPRFRRSHP